MNKKLYVVDGSTGYANWLQDMGMELVYDRDKADIAMFTGGADWQPWIYGEREGERTSCSPERDRRELEMYKFFVEKGIPMIGTCRGGQLFTIKVGGSLVQHSEHPWEHFVTTNEGEKLWINSLHHQQFLLEGCSKYDLLAWAEKLSDFHLNGYEKDYNFPDDYKEPEVVYFYETKCLAIQCHPEMMFYSGMQKGVKYFQSLVRKYILEEEITEPAQEKLIEKTI